MLDTYLNLVHTMAAQAGGNQHPKDTMAALWEGH